MNDQYSESAGACAVVDTEANLAKNGRCSLRLKASPDRLLSKQKTRKNPTVKSHERNHQMLDTVRSAAQIELGHSESTLVIIEAIKSQLVRGKVKPPTWRNLKWGNLPAFYHLGLKRLAEQDPHLHVVPFTFNLTPELVARASAALSFSSYLQERVHQVLKRELGRPVDFYFVVEIASGRPHLHGELLLAYEERRRKRSARSALHKLNDYTVEPRFKNHALRLDWKRADLGWSQYVSKHLAISSMYYDGKVIVKTQGCVRVAKKIYGEILKA